MKSSTRFGYGFPVLALGLWAGSAAFAADSAGPIPAAPTPAIADPQDKPFPGTIQLSIDATDIERKIVRVHEVIPVEAGALTLLYPKWLPGTHAPEGAIDRFAGLEIKANGQKVTWIRDPVDVYAFHLIVPTGTAKLDIDFQYLSPVDDDVGEAEITANMMVLEPIRLSLYPAGYFVRRIQVTPDVTLPAGWQFATALDGASETGGHVTFKTTPYETLADSPIFAGRYLSKLDLDPGGPTPVHMDVMADRPSQLEIKPEELAAHRALVQQSYRLFGSHHYDHYDFLVSLSDTVPGGGLEHHRSSEDSTYADYLTNSAKSLFEKDLLPHEYTHSWNGKFRRPADLWTPNYDVPMRDSLLWVYEGQTEYWGKVLAARSGLRNKGQALDDIAYMAAVYDNVPGRGWRPLQDTTNDEIIDPRRPLSWRSWQRFEDYYDEGALIWLDADTLIREMSKGAHSLDDFARSFFGIDDGSFVPVTYTFDDVVKALNAIQPYDWASFLRTRLDQSGGKAPLDGLRRGGYRLVYNDQENEIAKSMDGERKTSNFFWSLGFNVSDKDGELKLILWDSPAFKAELTAGMHIVAINGIPFDPDVLKEAVKAGVGGKDAIELIVKTTDRYKVVHLDYHGGLRYPHLERDPAVSGASLDEIIAARK
jgi:predicted metalloprotease with PDZ domain